MSTWADAWNRAGEGEDDFEPPKGAYTVRIVGGRAFAAQSDGREWCSLRLAVKDGEHAGRQFDHFGPAGEHNPVGFRIMREALIGYGLNADGIDDLDALDSALDRLVGTEASIGVSYNDRGYMQIRVHGSRTGRSDLDPPGGASSAPAPETMAPAPPAQQSFGAAAGRAPAPQSAIDDDIPF